jgi:anaerobic selenocysteine-containing dehydrogenase
VGDAEARAEVERHWGLAPGTIAPRPGRAALEIFEGLAAGDVRAVWIIATNPAASMPDLDLVEKALRQAELVIVQDAYHPTETTRFADVLLPAAQWPEKDGVMTSSERRLTLLPRLVEPPGEALPDTVIIARLAAELGHKSAFDHANSAAVFDEFAGAGIPRAGRATTRASATRGWRRRGRCSGRCRRRLIPAPSGCTPTAGSRRRTAAPASSRSSTPSPWSPQTRASRWCSPRAACAITGTP